MPVAFGDAVEVERGNRSSWQDNAKDAKAVDEVIDAFVESFGTSEAGTAKSVKGFTMKLPDSKSSDATVYARRFNDRIEKRSLTAKLHAGTRKDVLHLIVGAKPPRKPREVKPKDAENAS
jgi:hypothetical protein